MDPTATAPSPGRPATGPKPFSSLFAKELLKLQKTGLLRRVPAGAAVFSEGDPGDGMYLLERGAVIITTSLETGRGRIINRIEAGDYFGEMALLDDGPRSATATAEVESLVSFVPKADVLQLIRNSPTIVFDMMREFSLRIRATNRQVVDEAISKERFDILGRFSFSFAHDLKNPLAGISMAAELLADESIPADLRKTVSGQLVRQARRVAMMTEEMLAISRGTKPSINLQPVDLTQFMIRKIEEFRIDFRSRRLEISTENLPPNLSVVIDATRIEQLFLNLLHNSADAMTDGGKAWFRFETGDSRLAIELEDSGPGITRDRIEQVFEPFFTLGKPKGTGLGLSICRRVMEAHGGSIRAIFQQGRGAIFRMEFPLGR